jgi:MYXO-CTERM domain-containing protein
MRSKQNSRLLALVGAAVSTFVPALAFAAPTLVFSETWDRPDTSQWRALANQKGDCGNEPTCPDAAGKMRKIITATEANVCQGNYLSIPAADPADAAVNYAGAGGNVATRRASKIAAAAGDKFCMVAWAKQGNNPGGSGGYIAVNYVGADGNFVGGDVFSKQHYIAGSTFNGGNDDGTPSYGAYANIPKTNTWTRIEKGWTVATPVGGVGDVANGTTFFHLKFQLFGDNVGGGIGGVGVPAGGFSVGDVFVFKAPAADATACPDAAQFAQLVAGTNSLPVTCAAPTANCVKTSTAVVPAVAGVNTDDFTCKGCELSIGDPADAAKVTCPSATAPICIKAAADPNKGNCAKCGGDFGVGAPATNVCPAAANPLCKADGSCGKCAVNADCAAAAGGPHLGAICNVATGACEASCRKDRHQDDCAADQFCLVQGADTVGKCAAKLAAGQPIPATIAGGQCGNAEQGGKIVCASGTCSPGDNKCGRLNREDCVDGPQCRFLTCDTTSMKCGLRDGQSCKAANECQAGACSATDGGTGTCGRCQADGDCGINVGLVCNLDTGACDPGCRLSKGCPAGQECTSSSSNVGQCKAIPTPEPQPEPQPEAGPEPEADAGTPPSGGGDGGGCAVSPTEAGGLAAVPAGFVAGLALLLAGRRKRR